MTSSFQAAWRSPTPGKLLKLPFSPFASSATPTPSTNHHRFLSKNGNCLKLKLHCASSAGFGGYEKKMEERRGWDVLTKIIWVITSWKMWQCTRSLLRSQRGQEGGGCAQASHNLTRKAQGGCHLNFWGFPSAKNSQGTSLLYPLLSHKKKKILVNHHHQFGNLHELVILKYQPFLASRSKLGQGGRRDGCGWVKTQLPYFLTTSVNPDSPPVQMQSRY